MSATRYRAGEPAGDFFNYTDETVEVHGVVVEPELPYAISSSEHIATGWFSVLDEDGDNIRPYDQYKDRYSDDVVIFEKHVAYYAAGKGHSRAFHMDGNRLIHVCTPR